MNDADLIEQLAIHEARSSFWAFRQYMNPTMKLAWWQREIAYSIQEFYEQMLAGKRPKLVVEAPPQHGKSETIVDFIAWCMGKNPDTKTIYASFSARLGKRANKRLQRMMNSRKYRVCFPNSVVGIGLERSEDVAASRTQELIELVGREGSFRNTTVLGSITGESLSLGVIDDPIKGREQANSETIRDKTWDWFTDDFFTRFSENAGLLIILTRWHIDDPVGRMISIFPDMRVLKYKAIATEDEKNRKQGEPLMPEHKSLAFLLERKAALGTANFEALYQQNPIILGGQIIKGNWFPRVAMAPKITYRKVYADTAMKTAEANDYSVFECWGHGEDGKIYLLDLLRGKWEAPDLKRNFIEFWNKQNSAELTRMFGPCRGAVVEDKASGTGLIQDLKRAEPARDGRPARAAIPVRAQQRSIDKLTRVQDALPYIESGFVVLLEHSDFVSGFVSECEAFTADDSHAFDDQIDPMCDAIVDMLRKPRNSLIDAFINRK